MQNELSELYQEVILDHNKNPRNFGPIPIKTHSLKGHNPLCGDQITVNLCVEDGIVKDISFEGSGCAVSKASASIMTTLIKGQTIEKANEIFEQFHSLITSDMNEEVDLDSLGKIAVFAGVREYPSRIKCANLAWHTMKNALEDKKDNVVTENE